MSGPSQSASRIGGAKEQEVDALTDLLVQGMENEQEGDCYGICVKCREKVCLLIFLCLLERESNAFFNISRLSAKITAVLQWNISFIPSALPVIIAQLI